MPLLHFCPICFIALILCATCKRVAANEAIAGTWRKHTINDQSPFEAVGVADFNGDEKLDVFSGDSWYAAPAWTRNKINGPLNCWELA